MTRKLRLQFIIAKRNLCTPAKTKEYKSEQDMFEIDDSKPFNWLSLSLANAKWDRQSTVPEKMGLQRRL